VSHGEPAGGTAVRGPTYERVRDLIRSGRRGALVTVVKGEGLGAKLLVTRDGVEGTLGDPALDAEATTLATGLLAGEESATREAGSRELLIDVFAPQPRLVIIGAVDFASALAKLARFAGFRVTVVDPRAHFATSERIPDADRIVVAWPQEYLADEPPDDATYLAVLTHEPRFDDPTLTAALRSPAAYIGAMGSRRAHGERLDRLREAGFGDDELARISGPIGLDIGAATSEETAISILAEVIASRHGRSGRKLSERTNPVHSFLEREPLEGEVPVTATPEAGGPVVKAGVNAGVNADQNVDQGQPEGGGRAAGAPARESQSRSAGVAAADTGAPHARPDHASRGRDE
jgi:xanthine dehydrogenase accessory factor